MELSCVPPIYERRGVGAFTQDYASSCLAIEICIHTNSGGEDLHFATTAIKNMKSLVNIPKLMYTHTQTAKDIAHHTNTIKAYKKRAAVCCVVNSLLYSEINCTRF